MRIRNNGPARRSYSSYRVNVGSLNKNLEKLSSGYKINRSADDAAGLAISEKMRAQITGLSGAQQNAKQGIGLIQTTEGALQEYHEIVNRMLELSVKSANATYDDDVDREQLQKEMNRLAQELNRIADSTNFNEIFTLNGSGELVEDAKFQELVEDDRATLHGGDAYMMEIGLDMVGGVSGSEESEPIYNHYHSGILTARTGENAQWAFGGYTFTFNATEIPELKDQLYEFCKQYNEDPANNWNGWKARTLPDQRGVPGNEICFLANGDYDPRNEYAPREKGVGVRQALPCDYGDGLHDGGHGVIGGSNPGEASAAHTEVDFKENTGETMMGAVMLLGASGEYGKYQFVENESDAESGYVPIMIDSSSSAGDIAQSVSDTVEAPPGFRIQKVAYSEVSFQEIVENEEYHDTPALYVSVFKTTEDAEESINYIGSNVNQNNTNAFQTGNVRLLIGETGDEYNFLDVPIFDMHTDKVGLADVDISTQSGALNAIDKIKGAINKVSDVRGTHGALQNRLEHTIHYLGNAHENIQSAESVIRDADMADEMMKYTKNSILVQSAQSMMAQANLLPEGVLRLIQG